jgi:hypothetical protein
MRDILETIQLRLNTNVYNNPKLDQKCVYFIVLHS